MITAIVTSDNHLGAYYARLRPERLEQRRAALRHAFERVVDAAIKRGADLFLHAGDLFDRPDPRNAERAFVARQIRLLNDAGIHVFAIAGNHDSPRSLGYDGGALPQEEMDALGAIRLFRNTDGLEAETITRRGQKVCVWGMSSDFNLPPGLCPLANYVERHKRGGEIDLVLLHYSADLPGLGFAEEPLLSADNLDRLGAEAICVGHLHQRTERRLPGGALFVNPGATEHISFGEEGLPCGFWVLQCEPGRVRCEYVSLPTQPMRTLAIDVEKDAASLSTPVGDEDADEPEDALMHGLRQRIAANSAPDQLLRVRVTGSLPRERFQAVDLPALQAEGNARNFYCQLEIEGLTLFDPLGDTLLGYGVSFDAGEEMERIAREWERQLEDGSEDQEVTRLAGDALRGAYARLIGGGR